VITDVLRAENTSQLGGRDADLRRVRFLNDALHLTDPHLFADA
jgi:hypothetical protein